MKLHGYNNLHRDEEVRNYAQTQLKLMVMATRSPCQIIVYINSNKITLSHILRYTSGGTTHQDTKQYATEPCDECI